MNKNYKIRTGFIFIAFIALYAIALFNLFLIQIKNHDFYVHLGEKQYTLTVTRAPARAPIYDRHGKMLAMNKDSFSAFIVPRKIQNKAAVQKFLTRYFPQAQKRLNEQSDKHFMYIKRKLSDQELEIIRTYAPEEDIQILKEPSRYYPIDSISTVVGITDIDNHGVFGVELMFEKIVAGSPTTVSLKKDARSGYFYIEQETMVQGHTGSPVTLTIDSTLQFLVHEELKETLAQFDAQEGAALILNPCNGHIIAMSSAPDFDPNNTYALDLNSTKNKCISDTYEFGSVIKVFAALAALEENVVTPDEIIDCKNTRSTIIDGRRINTWKEDGLLPFCQVIQFSNNIGIAQVAQRIGDKLYDHYKRLGFGKKTGICLPGEQQGFVNPPHAWSKQSLISLSYGYEITATLAQLAHAFALIANDGCPIQPQLTIDPPPTTIEKKVCLYRPETIAEIKKMLALTVEHGTAQKARMKGYTVMGKTGTANLLINGTYAPDHNIYTCAGIVQKGDYKRVIVTFVKNAAHKNLYAAQVAAPLFERVAEKMVIHDKIL